MADFERLGGYRIGSNIPVGKGAVWENVARVARWGAPVIELNTNAERLDRQAMQTIREIAKANDIVYTWHVPPSHEESGELAVPDARQNEFGRKVMERAIKSASEVGARHITIHPSHQAGRLPQDQMYVYDEREKQVKVQRVIEGLSRDDSIKLLNDSTVAQMKVQINNIKSQYDSVKDLEKTAKQINSVGLDNANTVTMMGVVGAIVQHAGSLPGLQPEDYYAWKNIEEKVIRRESLTESERGIVKNYAGKVLDQVNNYKTYFESNIATLKPVEEHLKAGKPLISDGEKEMTNNFARNIALLDKEALKTAVKNGVSIGIENMPGQQLFSTPDELKRLREATVKALVDSKKLTKPEAEKLIGFTFDFAHANTTKYIDIGGKKFTNPEFIKELGKDIKHIHATDSIGIVDAHLALGQGEVKDQWEKIKDALNKSGFKGTAIHELSGAGLPVQYQVSMEFVEPGMYTTDAGQPTSMQWGPSYLDAGMTDPLMLEKDRGYFYESFVDIY